MKEAYTDSKKAGNVWEKAGTVWKKAGMFAVLLMTLMLITAQSAWAAEYPTGIKLNKTSVTSVIGNKFTLKATVSPADAEHPEVIWASSNPNVAIVNSKGKVKVTGAGTAKITAQTANKKKKATCTVKGVLYTSSNGKVTVGGPDGPKVYRAYDQNKYSSFYSGKGCVTTAVAIVGSAYGNDYSPVSIHTGSASKKYSERYALKKMKVSSALYGYAAMSVWTASTILDDMGVKNTAVYQFSDKKAVSDIKKNLQAGKPVIIKANSKVHNGIRLANGHHALVLVGIDDDGYVTWINPKTGRVNYAHAKGYAKYCKLTLDNLVKYHMDSAKGNYKTGFVTDLNAAGGYILVK